MGKTRKRTIDTINEQRAAIYIRISTKWQIDKDSLPLQRDELPKYAEMVLGIRSYEVFEDAGYFAKNTDRPAYQRMMARVRSGEFSINENEAAVVRMIYEMYRSDHLLLKVARDLNEKGLSQRSGKPWNPVTVSHILKSPFYCGKMRCNYRNEKHGLKNWSVRDEKEWIICEDHHPAIVSEEDWKGACKQLEANQRNGPGRNRAYTRKNTHIFAGLLTCGCCGRNMSATMDRTRADGWRPSIYNCESHRRFNTCKNKYISDVALGPFVLNYISNLMKAKKSFGKTTSIETFEKKLLRGDVFADVEAVERPGVEE